MVGIELAETAIEQLFFELGLSPDISHIDTLTRYQANNITIFVGNIFELSKATLGTIHAVYDRAALVALPQVVRGQYAHHVTAITQAPQLVVVYEYDQVLMAGPPFSITSDEIAQLYGKYYSINLLNSESALNELKVEGNVTENTWLLNIK